MKPSETTEKVQRLLKFILSMDRLKEMCCWRGVFEGKKPSACVDASVDANLANLPFENPQNTVKKASNFPYPMSECHEPNSAWPVRIKLFPAMGEFG